MTLILPFYGSSIWWTPMTLEIKIINKASSPRVYLYRIYSSRLHFFFFFKAESVNTQCQSQGLYLRDTLFLSFGDGVMWSHPHSLTWHSASVPLSPCFVFP